VKGQEKRERSLMGKKKEGNHVKKNSPREARPQGEGERSKGEEALVEEKTKVRRSRTL